MARRRRSDSSKAIAIAGGSRASLRVVLRRDPRILQLALAWLAILVVVALMVIAPYVLYARGRTIRNRLTFEVGAMELAIERASRAMADRERALRAFLYRPDAQRLEEHRVAGVALRSALRSAEVLATQEGGPWADPVTRLLELERDWERASSRLVARVSGDLDPFDGGDTVRPAPIYAEFQGVASGLLASLAVEKDRLVGALASADSARLVMPFWLALLGVPILLYVGRLSLDVVRLLGVARAEQERLARVLEHMVDPVLVTDRHGVVTLANPAARSLLGVARGASIRTLAPRLRAFDPPDREIEGDAPARMTPSSILAAIAAAEPLGGIEMRVRDGDEERCVGVTSAPITVGDEVAGAVSVLRDLSDRVHYERERLKTERFQALGAMAERLAHDFGNYLEAASAATAMLERPSASDPDRRMRWVKLIRTTIDEGRIVLAGLRTLSFISHRKPRFTSVELREVSTRAADIARMSRPDAGSIEIAMEVPSGLRVAASESDLVRALVNVLVNAIDATAAGGRVEVGATQHGGHALLSIRDTGAGIPVENRERIFDMYFTTKGERGSGMGLALAREVVHLHGGEIRLESTPGEGSTFTIVLPLAPARYVDEVGERSSRSAETHPEEAT